MDIIYRLKKEYSESGLPTAIADSGGKILWKNNADFNGKSGMLPELGESAENILGGRLVPGLNFKEADGELLMFNVIKMSDDDGGNCCVIEFVGSRQLGGTVSAAHMRDYIGYICSRIKTAAEEVVSAADSLFDELSENGYSIEKASFGRMLESAAMLEREAYYPDRIYKFTEPRRPDNIIILDKELMALAYAVQNALDRDGDGLARISEDYDRDIFFSMNADSFETAVASMAAECCIGGRYPERIVFSAKRLGRDRAEITVMSLYLGSLDKTSAEGFGACRTPAVLSRKLLAEYIYDVLSLKNGARFFKERLPCGMVCRMNIAAFPRDKAVLAERPVDGSLRRKAISEKIEFFFGSAPGAAGIYYSNH